MLVAIFRTIWLFFSSSSSISEFQDRFLFDAAAEEECWLDAEDKLLLSDEGDAYFGEETLIVIMKQY